jgi:hypothetical protein
MLYLQLALAQWARVVFRASMTSFLYVDDALKLRLSRVKTHLSRMCQSFDVGRITESSFVDEYTRMLITSTWEQVKKMIQQLDPEGELQTLASEQRVATVQTPRTTDNYGQTPI